jgi:glutamate racemase
MNADLVVMDWGIGGLSVYNEIRRLMPHLSIVYYSDSGQIPYGKMPVRQLRARVHEIILSFAARDVSHFVVACNAASTVLPELAGAFAREGLNVVGVIEHGVELIRQSPYKNIGVIGGRRTILSRHFSRPFRQPQKKVTGRIAQPLSALIEKGDLHGPQMRETLKQILKPLKSCEALVLACTHYPAVAPQIQKLLPACQLLDPAQATAHFVHRHWKFVTANSRRQIFMTSGKGRPMIRAAKLAFGTRISKVIEV